MMKLSFKQLIYFFTAFSVCLLAFRVSVSNSLAYIFLPWNLFLAMIPWWLSSYLTKNEKLSLNHLPIFLVWLLFIPNSPYILTDLFHLKIRQPFPLWFDLILILSFALIGMLVFIKSLQNMFLLIQNTINVVYAKALIPFLFWLISYGLYLGRYLRFNSWNVINHPFRILRQGVNALFELEVIAFTCIFSFFLWFVYFISINLFSTEKDEFK